MKPIRALFSTAQLAAAIAIVSHAAVAQTTTELKPTKTDATADKALAGSDFSANELVANELIVQHSTNKNYYRVAVKNLPLRMMAWLLDPEHQPMPQTLAISNSSAESVSQMTDEQKQQIRSQLMQGLLIEQAKAVPGQGMQWRLLPLKNVPPDVMAYMIDPRNNLMPDKVIATPLQAPTKPKPEKMPRPTGGLFELPAGVETMVPAASQNGLLIQSTEEGARQLQNILDLLDRPLRQVEIKAQVVEMSDAELKGLGLDFAAVGATSTFQLGFGRGDYPSRLNHYPSRLNQLVEQNKAKVLASFGVTVVNNMTGSMGVVRSTPAIVGTKDEAGNFKTQFDATQKTPTPGLLLTTEAGFFVTPTVNNDGTITLVLQASKSMELTTGEKKTGVMLPFGSHSYNRTGAALPQRTANGIALSDNAPAIQTVVNLRDSDTIVMLSPAFANFGGDLPADENSQTKPNTKTIVFFTAHVLPLQN